jgi:hypothetical protein
MPRRSQPVGQSASQPVRWFASSLVRQFASSRVCSAGFSLLRFAGGAGDLGRCFQGIIAFYETTYPFFS